MTKLLKKILIIALAVVCSLSLIACADTDKGETETGLFCKKLGGVYTIYKYVDDGETTALDIGKALTDLGIDDKDVRIQKQVFSGNSSLKEIIVPDTVTKIEKGAFAGMKALESLTIPFVGMNANGDASIYETAPSADKATDSERTIAHLFGEDDYDEGVSQTISYGINSTTNEDGSTTTQTTTCYIPLTLKKITVTGNKIPACAFNGLTKAVAIELTGAVLVIGDYAFASATQLSAITLPTSVEKIGVGAFSGATNLESVNLDKLTALTEIGEKAFENTALTAVSMPTLADTTKNLKVGVSAFAKCKKLTELTLTASVNEISRYAFMGCEKLAVIETTGLTANSILVGNYAFADCEKKPAKPAAFDISASVNAYPAP